MVQRPSPESSTLPEKCLQVFVAWPAPRRSGRATRRTPPSRAARLRRCRRGSARSVRPPAVCRSGGCAGCRSPRPWPASCRIRCRCGSSSRSARRRPGRRGGSPARRADRGPRGRAVRVDRCQGPGRARKRSDRGAAPPRLAADHQAVAALQAPDAAGRAAIDVVDALLLQRLAAADVVLVVGVAAVDDDVARWPASWRVR